MRLRKNWSQTQDVTPIVAVETLPPDQRQGCVAYFVCVCVCVGVGGDIFGREKGEGSSIFFPLQQYIKLHANEETLHSIVHWSTDIINNWKMGRSGEKQNVDHKTKHRSWSICYTEPHTKDFRWKTESWPYMHDFDCRPFQIQVTMSASMGASMSASMKLNVAMNWVIAASVLIIVTWDLYTAHRQQTHHRLCHHSDPVLTLRLYNI